MKVEINSQALADAVAWTTRVIDARPATPILAGIRLEAIDGTLQLSAFNYAISARHHIEAGIDEAGTALVLGKLLADITKSLPSEKTYLSTDGSTMTITSGKSTFTMQLMPDNEYPDLPVVPAKLGQVDSPTFMQAVNQASVAVSREENRPVLTGIRVQFQGDKVIMSSTDRFRLSRSSFTWTPENPDINTTALVRGALLRDVARSLDEHQNIVLDFDPESPSLLGFENAGRVSTSQLIDGEFPAVDRLYADEYPIHAIIDKQSLIGAIKRVSLVAERNAPIRMAFAGQELTLLYDSRVPIHAHLTARARPLPFLGALRARFRAGSEHPARGERTGQNQHRGSCGGAVHRFQSSHLILTAAYRERLRLGNHPRKRGR